MSRIIQYLNELRKPSHLAFLACLLMLVGLFFSRALISIGMMGLLLSAIIMPNWKENIQSFIKEKSLVLFVIYFLMMAISFFWSYNKQYYVERMQIMLPFLVLPFAFHSISQWKTSWYHALMLVFITSVSAGMIWSLCIYFSNKEMYDAGYGVSKVIPTPFKGDHIRFSIAVVASIAFLFSLLLENSFKKWRIFLIACLLLAIAYLHILSVKTGLLAFYLVVFAFLFKLILLKSTRKYALLGLVLIVVLPIAMYKFSTSFRIKLHYIEYSYVEMKNADLQANVSDEGRLISYRYALEIIKAHPLLGVGLGDVYDEMNFRFKRDIPDFLAQALLPHNQFLMVATAIGLLAMLFLLFTQAFFFYKSLHRNFLFFAIWFILLLAMMIEPLYETQYGTCLYLFLLIFTWKKTELPLVESSN